MYGRSGPKTGCILVNIDNRILIVHNTESGMWGFPKGGRKKGEKILDAALRELKEETGVVLDPTQIMTSFTYRESVMYFAKGQFDTTCVVDGTEIDEYAWLTLKELQLKNTSNFTKRFLGRVGTAIKFRTYVPNLAEFAIRGYANHDSAHNYQHAQRVMDTAYNILCCGNIKPSPLELREFPYVMLGHDLRDYKLESTALPANEIFEFYRGELGEESAKKIIYIHENCSWSKRNSSTPLPSGDWMRRILQDADWIDAIGAIGLQRCIAFTEHHYPEADIPSIVCAHIREKLLLIPEGLNYDESRDIVSKHRLLDPLIDYLADNEK